MADILYEGDYTRAEKTYHVQVLRDGYNVWLEVERTNPPGRKRSWSASANELFIQLSIAQAEKDGSFEPIKPVEAVE